MNIFLQFISFEQEIEQFRLFELIHQILDDSRANDRFTWVGLNGKMKSVESLEKLRACAQTERFSQIGYEAKLAKKLQLPGGLTVREAFAVLQLPPTSPLWANSDHWCKSNVPTAYRRARGARNVETMVEKSKVKRFPSVLECTIKYTGKKDPDLAANAFEQRICKMMQNIPLGYLSCAVADIGGEMLFSKIEELNLDAVEFSIVHFLYRYVGGTHLLGKKIDRIHKIHVLPAKLCDKMAVLLGLPAPKVVSENFKVLTIPEELLQNAATDKKVFNIAIPRDHSTSWARFA